MGGRGGGTDDVLPFYICTVSIPRTLNPKPATPSAPAGLGFRVLGILYWCMGEMQERSCLDEGEVDAPKIYLISDYGPCMFGVCDLRAASLASPLSLVDPGLVVLTCMFMFLMHRC